MSDDDGEVDDVDGVGRILDKNYASIFTYLWLIQLFRIGAW